MLDLLFLFLPILATIHISYNLALPRLNISKATTKEIPEIANVYAEAFRSVGEDWSTELAEQLIEHLFRIQPDLFYVVKNEGVIVGGIWGVIRPWIKGNALNDIELFIHPEHQGKHYSLHLYKAILSDALERYRIVEICELADETKEFPFNYYIGLGSSKTGLVHIAGNANEVLQNVNFKIEKHGDK